MRKWIAFFTFLLCLDIGSKILAIFFIPPLEAGLYPFHGIPIFSSSGITFSLNYVVNTGAAWGVFAGHSGWLFALRSLIILSILFFVPKRIPIWFIVIGAVGNAIDYCLYGHVIDFIHFTFWGYQFPIFNIADSCITIGAFCLLLFSRKALEARAQ